MNFNQELGLKIKKLRLNEKLTLVECSELTGLSVGFFVSDRKWKDIHIY